MHRLVAKSVMASSPRLLSFAGSLRPSSILGIQVAPLLRPICKKYHHRSVKLSNEVSKITRRLSRMKILDDEADHSHIMWWKEMMRMCRKPSSLLLVERLKYTNLLGLDINLRNGSLKEGTLNLEILQFKSRFPREVLLCRVGDFYEAIGFDACVLVEHAGLNPFGGLRSDSIPKAGCPVVNLRQTLDDLTRNGFSVVDDGSGSSNIIRLGYSAVH